MKIEFSSQRREMLFFLTTNMAAVTSRANNQLFAIPQWSCADYNIPVWSSTEHGSSRVSRFRSF